MTDQQEPASIASRDWRLQAITTLAEPFHAADGHVYPVGAPVELVSPMLFERQLLFAPVANPSALLLSLAARLAASARPHLDGLARLELVGNPKTRQVHGEAAEAFFAALEDLVGCTVFSVAALEAFANGTIPDDFVHEAPRGDGRCTEMFDKQQVERHVSLEVKLDQILPKIRKVPSPKGSKLWGRFVAMRDLRDRLIHLKSSDTKAIRDVGTGPAWPDGLMNYLWSLLLTERVTEFPTSAKEMMAHYYPNCPQDMPRWLRKCPL